MRDAAITRNGGDWLGAGEDGETPVMAQCVMMKMATSNNANSVQARTILR
jgi:hypothetical protein